MKDAIPAPHPSPDLTGQVALWGLSPTFDWADRRVRICF